MWPVYSPTAALSLKLLVSRRSLAQPRTRISSAFWNVSTGLAWYLSSKCFLISFLPALKGIAAVLLGGISTAPSLASLSAFSLPGISWCSGIHIRVTLLCSLSHPSTYINSHTLDDSTVLYEETNKCTYVYIRIYLRQHSHEFPTPLWTKDRWFCVVLPVWCNWCPYFKWLYQLVLFHDSILV